MNTSPTTLDQQSAYRERLQQAKRVMEGLVEAQQTDRFNINIFAAQRGDHIIGCIAGLCGLDPWFQKQGFVTRVASYYNSLGDVSIGLRDFFGTDIPFYASNYEADKPVTVEDAIRALDRALERFSSDQENIDSVANSAVIDRHG